MCQKSEPHEKKCRSGLKVYKRGSPRFAGKMPCPSTLKQAWAVMVLLAVPEAAEDDCESFLSVRSTRKSTSGIILYTMNGLCIPDKDKKVEKWKGQPLGGASLRANQ